VIRNRWFFILFSCLALTVTAHSELGIPGSELPRPGNFYEPEKPEVELWIKDWQKVSRATFQIRSHADHMNCSAFSTSNTGHGLTSLHCFRECLVEGGWFRRANADLLHRTGKPYPATCSVTLNGQAQPAEILATGYCSSGNPELCSGDNDFLAFRIPSPSPSQDCLPVRGDSTPVHNERIAAVGFPGVTQGRIQNSQGGGREYFSFGQAIRTPPSCISTQVTPSGTLNRQRVLIAPFKGLEAMTVDTWYGSSGGPIIDPQGAAIGIASANSSPQTGVNYCAGSTFFNPVYRIQELALPQLGISGFEKMFECPR